MVVTFGTWNKKERTPHLIVDHKYNSKDQTFHELNSKIEALYLKRQISECIICQRCGPTKNYYNKTPRCVKYLDKLLTKDCLRETIQPS